MVQGSEENKGNGLTRAGGKCKQVMPDGAPTVMWESFEHKVMIVNVDFKRSTL